MVFKAASGLVQPLADVVNLMFVCTPVLANVVITPPPFWVPLDPVVLMYVLIGVVDENEVVGPLIVVPFPSWRPVPIPGPPSQYN